MSRPCICKQLNMPSIKVFAIFSSNNLNLL